MAAGDGGQFLYYASLKKKSFLVITAPADK